MSLSTNGTRLTVGAKHAAGNNTGSVRVYDWKTDPTWSDYPTEKWVAVSLDILAEAAGDAAGFDVSMAGDGSRVAIGAPESDANGTDSGQVRVYELERWDAIAPWPPPWATAILAAANSESPTATASAYSSFTTAFPGNVVSNGCRSRRRGGW